MQVATYVNSWEPAVYMSCMSQNFRFFSRIEFIRSKISIFLLIYTGSLSAWRAGRRRSAGRMMCHDSRCRLLPSRAPVMYRRRQWPADRQRSPECSTGRPLRDRRQDESAQYSISLPHQAAIAPRARPCKRKF